MNEHQKEALRRLFNEEATRLAFLSVKADLTKQITSKSASSKDRKSALAELWALDRLITKIQSETMETK